MFTKPLGQAMKEQVKEIKSEYQLKKSQKEVSEKSRLVAFLLCTFLGVIGAHRFYVRKHGTGILQLFTFGLYGVWTLFDWVLILVGVFKDKDGKEIKKWLD